MVSFAWNARCSIPLTFRSKETGNKSGKTLSQQVGAEMVGENTQHFQTAQVMPSDE